MKRKKKERVREERRERGRSALIALAFTPFCGRAGKNTAGDRNKYPVKGTKEKLGGRKIMDYGRRGRKARN